MLNRRKDASGSGPAKIVDRESDEFFAHFPALWEFLLADTWPGSTDARDRGSLLLFVQDGVIKVRLQDPNTDEQLWLAYEGLWELLQGTDRHLKEGTGDWRRIALKGQQRKR